MNFTRRETLAVSGAALAASVLPLNLMASTPDLISGITGGAEASSTGISLTAPEIAEKWKYCSYFSRCSWGGSNYCAGCR